MDAVMYTNSRRYPKSCIGGILYHALVIILESCKYAVFALAGGGFLWKQAEPRMVGYPVGQIPGNIYKRKLYKNKHAVYR
jgi:hypothetical protein